MAGIEFERSLTFWSLVFVWSSFYGLRQLIYANIVFMQNDWSYSKEQLGSIVSSFAFSYGIGKFLSGNLVDRLNPKRLLLTGLLASGTLLLFFPLVPNWLFSLVVTTFFGLFAGTGWPGCAKLLILWYTPEEKGFRYSLVSLCGNVAAAVIPLAVSRITQWGYPWWYSFFAIGCTSVSIACIGHKTVFIPTKYAAKDTVTRKTPPKTSYYQAIVCNRTLWCLCGFSFLMSMTRYSIISWSQVYFVEHAELSPGAAAVTMIWYQVGGVAGSFLCGTSSDWFIKKKLYPLNSPRASGLGIFAFGYMICFWLYATTIYPGMSQTWLYSLLFLLGLFGEGAATPSGLASMETVDKSRSGSVHAFLSLVSQAGNLIAGFPFSMSIAAFGWGLSYKCVSVLPIGAVTLIGLSTIFKPPILIK